VPNLPFGGIRIEATLSKLAPGAPVLHMYRKLHAVQTTAFSGWTALKGQQLFLSCQKHRGYREETRSLHQDDRRTTSTNTPRKKIRPAKQPAGFLTGLVSKISIAPGAKIHSCAPQEVSRCAMCVSACVLVFLHPALYLVLLFDCSPGRGGRRPRGKPVTTPRSKTVHLSLLDKALAADEPSVRR